MKKPYTLLLPILIVWSMLWIACRKDPIPLPLPDPCNPEVFSPAPPDSCADLSDSLRNCCLFYLRTDSLLWYSPRYNPRNPDEIIYTLIFSGKLGGELWKFNLCTGENLRLATDVMLYPNDWSKKGWILFHRTDYQIWKIKDNGDSLQQITNQYANYTPRWLGGGDQFIYYRQKHNDNKWFIRDLDGKVDTLPIRGERQSPSSDGKRLVHAPQFGDNIYLKIYDFETGKISELAKLHISEVGTTISTIEWRDNDQKLLWTCRKGIFQTDVSTGHTEVIVSTPCLSQHYTHLTIAPDEKHFIATRGKTWYEAAIYTEWSNLYLVRFSADASEELRIEVDK
ncbi:MAG: hypothetical protein R3C61_06970 [Bacteroidia bacterium]